MPNALANATSPYLRQHRDNPVEWLQWGPDVFARAEAEHKPILLSIGYAACHWCHVMAHESFEDQDTARLMNENFVCVKVDREERPDLDLVYQSALSAFESQGGWPLTMFLAADGVPFWGGTYFPPEPRWGKPSFGQVLRSIADVYRAAPDKARHSTQDLARALMALGEPTAQGARAELSANTLDLAANAVLNAMDPHDGGLQGAPKFPQLTALDLVWRGYLRTGVGAMRHAVTLSLDRMSQGGLYDHLGGGYARYCVDDRWLVPHFEKMLYDNALFVDVLTTVWRTTKSPLYAARVRETIAWLLREMRTGEGALAASFDADSEGEEGRFYVWTESQIDAVLGPDAPAFKKAYDVTPGGNWAEGDHPKVILNRLHNIALGDAASEASLARSRDKLLAVRAKRVPPERDDKVLADWNGLAIAALVNAATSFLEPSWLKAAEDVFAVVVKIHVVPEARSARLARDPRDDDGNLYHSSFAGTSGAQGFLDDYANMARAALALYEATGKSAYLERALTWVRTLATDFAGNDGSFFYASAHGDERLLVRPRHANDGPQPSGNGTLAGVLARLHLLTANQSARVSASAILAAFSGMASKYPVAFATLLNSFEALISAQQIMVIAKNDDPLVGAAFGAPRPDRVVQVLPPGAELPAGHPAHGKQQVGGKPTAYVCVGTTCSLPVHTTAELSALLQAPRAS
ncbi:MAG: thioredoxin domain-containing protein [Alphaproteobacteria bacterium]|nr:thioredoxin domain-containing protein [Alphaproteobacteria bacterium]